MKLSFFYILTIVILMGGSASAQKIVVAQDGTGNFTTIQAAINSIPAKNKTNQTIFIKKGTYVEKIFVENDCITFEGEDRSATIIVQSIARDEWRCTHPDDWGTATFNVGANDITLKNLTIKNSFGFDFKQEYTINCPTDTAKGEKKITKSSHQMALRVMKKGTKLQAINCHFIAWGGDTVSPWEPSIGLWYFKSCIMEGGVDFYCPRGWAWAEDCEFIAHSGMAAIWHDGSAIETSATVLKNCRFKGFDNFYLGRYHRDAQFYLINCQFADNMKDQDIYQVKTNNEIKWGRRVYFFNCQRAAGNYAWFQNNIDQQKADSISIKWLFGDKWTVN